VLSVLTAAKGGISPETTGKKVGGKEGQFPKMWKSKGTNDGKPTENANIATEEPNGTWMAFMHDVTICSQRIVPSTHIHIVSSGFTPYTDQF